MTTPMLALSTGIRAKTNLIDRLKAEAAGGVLRDLSVDYSYNAGAGRRSLYGGGWRGTPTPVIAESYGGVYAELVIVPIYIRVKGEIPGTDVAVTDGEADQIAATIAAVMARNPRLAGGMSWLGIAGAVGTYAKDDVDTISIAGYQVQIQTLGTWGP